MTQHKSRRVHVQFVRLQSHEYHVECFYLEALLGTKQTAELLPVATQKRAWCQLLADSRSTVGGHLQSPRCVCRRAVCLSIYPYDYPSPYLTILYFGYLSIGVFFLNKCLLIYLFSCLCLCIYLSVCLFHVQTKSIGIETQRAQTN